MASISKVMPSAANFQVEISPAIANLNFDFSLYRVQPPVEFEGVGSALSCLRREEAEGGRPHITARKLGALFGALLPPIPQLIKTYGNRASEISHASSITQQGRNAYGPFGSRAGADATSLWAAATSGKEAIAVHLLACMLARIWERSEAVSIWVEIVERRKQDILANFEKDNIADMASLAAARQDLTRIQLAEWDASARAWLEAADVVKNRQQKQLSLIIDNMEGLVNGISQKAQTGGILLALSAWHLYPDMMVVVPCVTHVRQKDPMFASGGVVTIGLEKPNSDQKGVFWSLPLAHLRHYGAPVVLVRSLDSDEKSRLSLTELLQATLGCVLHSWGLAGSNTMETVGWLSNLSDLLNVAASAGNSLASLMIRGDAEASWLNLILLAAKYHLECSGHDRVLAKTLVSLGRRHGRTFLGLANLPLFGLQHLGTYTGLLVSEERKVEFLRSIASDFVSKQKHDGRDMFIRYRRHYNGCKESVYEYATAVPGKGLTSKRKFGQSGAGIVGHVRWLYSGGDLTRRCNDAEYRKRFDAVCGPRSGIGASHISGESFFSQNASYNPTPWLPLDSKYLPSSRVQIGDVYFLDRYSFSKEGLKFAAQDFQRRKIHYEAVGEQIFTREDYLIEDFAAERMGIFWDRAQPYCVNQNPWYRYMYGDMESAALFISEGKEHLINLHRTVEEDTLELFSMFKEKIVDGNAVIEKLDSTFRLANVEADPYLKSLKALSTAAKLYRDLPEASVDVRILQQSLYKSSWAERSYKTSSLHYLSLKIPKPPEALQTYILDQAQSFACLTQFDSGHYDTDPGQLQDVMAMSSGNSLYIGSGLLCDPSDESSFGGIRRIPGNIGRPGLAYLVPPVDPLVKTVTIEDWRHLSHDAFDGRLQNCFESTSLHLSFTGASSPINYGFSGGQDADVYILETLISIHEGARWIADLNPMKSVLGEAGGMMLRLKLPSTEGCDMEICPESRIISIDNWFQLIEPPEERLALVRAHKNWQARLAATALSIQKGFLTVVLPEKVCWKCFDSHIKYYLDGTKKKIVVIG